MDDEFENEFNNPLVHYLYSLNESHYLNISFAEEFMDEMREDLSLGDKSEGAELDLNSFQVTKKIVRYELASIEKKISMQR